MSRLNQPCSHRKTPVKEAAQGRPQESASKGGGNKPMKTQEVSLDQILQMVKDPKAAVREAGVSMLRGRRGPEVVRALFQATRDGDERVWSLARTILDERDAPTPDPRAKILGAAMVKVIAPQGHMALSSMT